MTKRPHMSLRRYGMLNRAASQTTGRPWLSHPTMCHPSPCSVSEQQPQTACPLIVQPRRLEEIRADIALLERSIGNLEEWLTSRNASCPAELALTDGRATACQCQQWLAWSHLLTCMPQHHEQSQLEYSARKSLHGIGNACHVLWQARQHQGVGGR